jgi:hypothetical protein
MVLLLEGKFSPESPSLVEQTYRHPYARSTGSPGGGAMMPQARCRDLKPPAALTQAPGTGVT